MKRNRVRDAGQIAVCVPDNIGRLIGKRLPAARWDEIARNGMPMPDYFLVTGIENRPHTDLEVTGYHTGFNNGLLKPIPETRFRIPTEPKTLFFLSDAIDKNGTPIAEAVRNVLIRQVERLHGHGLTSSFASELEFYVYRNSYAEAHEEDYRSFRPFYHRHADNDVLNAGFAEPLLDDIREAMRANGVTTEATQGEGGIGQYEINLRHTDPLAMADRHVIFKHVVKAVSQARDHAATFMAKISEDQAGSSGHVHVSLYDRRGRSIIGKENQLSQVGRRFLAGLLRFTPELTLLHAPYANSYRRLQPGTFAPSNLSWGWDNRTVMVRVMGCDSLRFEFRLPGADMNPYLSFAAILAAGIEGIERNLTPPRPVIGNAYDKALPGVPRDLGEALAAFRQSKLADRAFTPAVHRHLASLAAKELHESRRAVTDWDLKRGFDTA